MFAVPALDPDYLDAIRPDTLPEYRLLLAILERVVADAHSTSVHQRQAIEWRRASDDVGFFADCLGVDEDVLRERLCQEAGIEVEPEDFSGVSPDTPLDEPAPTPQNNSLKMRELIAPTPRAPRAYTKPRSDRGVPRIHPKPIKGSKYQSQVGALIAQGLTIGQVAEQLKINRLTVARCFRDAGVPKRPHIPKGSRVQYAADVHQLKAQGLGVAQIASQLGLTWATAWRCFHDKVHTQEEVYDVVLRG